MEANNGAAGIRSIKCLFDLGLRCLRVDMFSLWYVTSNNTNKSTIKGVRIYVGYDFLKPFPEKCYFLLNVTGWRREQKNIGQLQIRAQKQVLKSVCKNMDLNMKYGIWIEYEYETYSIRGTLSICLHIQTIRWLGRLHRNTDNLRNSIHL